MTPRTNHERGSAMLMALGVLTILALLALVVVTVVTREKRTAFSEYTNTRSFYSADAASEAGVNWLRNQFSPPDIVDASSHVIVNTSYTTLGGPNRYKYNVAYVRKRFRPGWSTEYKDYEYRVDASGASADQSSSAVTLSATHLYREGY